MVVLSTTAQPLYGPVKNRTFVIEADAGNSTNNVRISSKDQNVVSSFVTLKAGQSLVFNNWTGQIWAVASGSTPTVNIEFEAEGTASITTKGAGS